MAIKTPQTPQEKAFTLWKKFMEKQEMSDFFLWFSHEVWESQKFARFAKTHEVELTNLLVRSLMQAIYYGQKQAFPIRIFHARKESENGRDLEIIYQLAPDKNIKFYCQAKRLYADKPNIAQAKYDALDHKDGTYSQIKSLIDYSKDGGYPLYLFYNYAPNVNAKTDYEYGCTLVSAYYLYQQYQKRVDLTELRFQDLEGVARPLTSLCTVSQIADVKKWEGNNDFKARVELFEDKIFDNPQEKRWKEFLKLRATTQGMSHASDLESFLKMSKSETGYEYRIVITQKPIHFMDRERYHL